MFFIFLAWLLGKADLSKVVLLILLFTSFVVLTGIFMDLRKRHRYSDALANFIKNMDENSKLHLLSITQNSHKPCTIALASHLSFQSQKIKDTELELKNYREFIEAWTHEIKTPLSLSTLILNNHKKTISPYVYSRLDYAQRTISNNVDRILYYARLQQNHVDYQFEDICLSSIVCEVLEDFKTIGEEKRISVNMEIPPIKVKCDKRALLFILRQLLSNAFKYAAAESGKVSIVSWIDYSDGGKIHLTIRDNGKGVSVEDAPFIFDKGFTGCHSNRQEATGMGLYLVSKYAQALSFEVKIEPVSTTGHGFSIVLIFPAV